MNFFYRSFLKNGFEDRGVIEAASRPDALRRLLSDGRTVFELNEAAPAQTGQGPSRFALPFGNLRADPGSLFSDLAMLTAAGLTVSQALHSMRKAGSTAADKAAAEIVASEMAAGKTAAAAFSKLGNLPEDALLMIASGENAGSLPQVFAGLATRMEERAKARTMVLNALAYPAFLLVLMTVAIGVVTFGLVPSIEPVFANSGKPAPFAIKAFAWLRTIANTAFPYVIFTLATMGLFALLPSVRVWLAGQLRAAAFRLPILGSVMRDDGLSRYLSSLSMLLENGAPMAQSLSMAAQSAAFVALRTSLMKVRDDVSAGKRLPDALQDTGLFEERTLSLISVGYEAGRLPQVASRAAALIDARSRDRLNRFVSLLTPTLTIFMGLVIGGLVVSVMTALLAINELAI